MSCTDHAQDSRSGTITLLPGTGLATSARPTHGPYRTSFQDVSQMCNWSPLGRYYDFPRNLANHTTYPVVCNRSLRLFITNLWRPLRSYHIARPIELPVYSQAGHPLVHSPVLPAASYHTMNKANKTFSYTPPHDRPATPPESSPNVTRDEHHLHLLKANHALEFDENATCRGFPANPPSTPNLPPEDRLPGHSPTRMSVSPTPPSTPPRSAPTGQSRTSFIFSKTLMTSKKLSSSVHGKKYP